MTQTKHHPEAPYRRLALFLGLSALGHVVAAPLLVGSLDATPGSTRKVQKVRMVSLPARGGAPRGTQAERRSELARADKNQQAPQPKLREELAKREEEKKKEDKLDGQVVDLPPSADERAPERASYLSEHNTRTDRETVSRHQSKDYKNVMNEPTVARKTQVTGPPTEASAKVLELALAPPSPDDAKAKPKAPATALELPDVHKRQELALKLDPAFGSLRNHTGSEELRGNSNRLRLELGGEPSEPERDATRGGAPTQGAPNLALIPGVGVLAKLTGGPSNDYLPDVEEGEGTFLNSREFKYASFFNRMKRGVSQHWNPVGEYRRRDPSGNVYGQATRITVLQVTLDPAGKLAGVAVTRSSGLEFLDDEAMYAFKRAEPFPNPPKGLVNDEGLISFPFAFSLEFRDGGLRLPF